MIPKSHEKCARCPNTLSALNTNPDRLCGPCQRHLAPHHGSTARYTAWVASGKPRVDVPEAKTYTMVKGSKLRFPRKSPKASLRLPLDPAKLDTGHLLALLGACKAEVQKRQGEARAILAALEG